jgi:hypothetical protein
MSTRDLAQKMTGGGAVQELYVIQKYIKSKGPNAFVIRAHYRKNRPPHSYVITNKISYFENGPTIDEQDKYVTNCKKSFGCSIIHTKGGKVSDESAEQIEKIVKFFEKYTGNFIQEFVADFVKDESGLLWFVGCRGFKIVGNNSKPTLKYFMLEIGICSDTDSDSNKKKSGD